MKNSSFKRVKVPCKKFIAGRIYHSFRRKESHAVDKIDHKAQRARNALIPETVEGTRTWTF